LLKIKYQEQTRFSYNLLEDPLVLLHSRRYRHLYTLRLTLLFYINLKLRNFQKMAKKAKKLDGYFEENFLLLLECRLPAAIYRSALITNMFDAFLFVKKRNVIVNGLIVPYINYVVPLMKIVQVEPIVKGLLICNF
jgi:ribosomal protein S4